MNLYVFLALESTNKQHKQNGWEEGFKYSEDKQPPQGLHKHPLCTNNVHANYKLLFSAH